MFPMETAKHMKKFFQLILERALNECSTLPSMMTVGMITSVTIKVKGSSRKEKNGTGIGYRNMGHHLLPSAFNQVGLLSFLPG
jgi:hypothetical protein